MSSQTQQNDNKPASAESTKGLISSLLQSLSDLQNKVDEHHNSVNEKCDEIMKRISVLEQNLKKMEEPNSKE